MKKLLSIFMTAVIFAGCAATASVWSSYRRPVSRTGAPGGTACGPKAASQSIRMMRPIPRWHSFPANRSTGTPTSMPYGGHWPGSPASSSRPQAPSACWFAKTHTGRGARCACPGSRSVAFPERLAHATASRRRAPCHGVPWRH